jgi:hypothetical protein
MFNCPPSQCLEEIGHFPFLIEYLLLFHERIAIIRRRYKILFD